MIKRIAVTALILIALTGCTPPRMSVEEMREVAAARDACVELGGVFQHWSNEFGLGWRCDFDTID